MKLYIYFISLLTLTSFSSKHTENFNEECKCNTEKFSEIPESLRNLISNYVDINDLYKRSYPTGFDNTVEYPYQYKKVGAFKKVEFNDRKYYPLESGLTKFTISENTGEIFIFNIYIMLEDGIYTKDEIIKFLLDEYELSSPFVNRFSLTKNTENPIYFTVGYDFNGHLKSSGFKAKQQPYVKLTFTNATRVTNCYRSCQKLKRSFKNK